MRRIAVLLLALSTSSAARAQGREDLAPSYSRGGFDYYSAPVEPPAVRSVPHSCERQYGKHTEVQELPDQRLRCSVTTPSEPRLSSRLKEELAMIDDLSEPKRQKVVDTLVEKFAKLAQCPAGTQAYYDGSLYFCRRDFAAKELCSTGVVAQTESGELGCVVSTCAKGTIDLSRLTEGRQKGCFRCPRGAYDAKETAAFHGALKGLQADYTEVFCRAKSDAATDAGAPSKR